MEREKVIQTMQELESETKVKAWLFEVDKKFYEVAVYSMFRVGDKSSIWETNKRGKRRKTKTPIFSIDGNDHIKCVNRFLDLTFPDLENEKNEEQN